MSGDSVEGATVGILSGETWGATQHCRSTSQNKDTRATRSQETLPWSMDPQELSQSLLPGQETEAQRD